MRILVIMDPPSRVDRFTDSTVAIIEEALGLGHEVAVATPADLWLEGDELGVAYHHALAPLPGGPEPTALRVGKGAAARLRERFDVVLMRKAPPFDIDYYFATQLLERLRDRVPVVNDPRGLREANEKLYTLRFPRLIPPSMVARGPAALLDFLRRQGGEIVVKPLDAGGGAGVLHLHLGDRNLHALLELVTANGTRLVMAQRYLPEARQGDKRILLMGGEPIGALLRVPREDETRANLHVGGQPAPARLDERDLEIVAAVAPHLAADGLWLVGLDVIGGMLTEVNVTSPTGVREIDRLEGRLEGRRDGSRLAARIVEGLVKFVSAHAGR